MQGPFHVRFFLFLLLVALTGCARLRPTPVPISTVSYPGTGQSRTLVVLLPGRYDSPEDFGRYGFPEERVFTAEGGHDWKAWRALWADFVRTGALSPSGAAGINPP